MIDHGFLDAYESVKGEYEKLAWGLRPDKAQWQALDGLLLDLHLIRHGYATDGYTKHIEHELKRLCADASVVERVKAMRL